MLYKLVILKSAADDTLESYKYYEKIRQGLGDRFLTEVLDRYRDISRHQEYFGFIDGKKIIRDVKLKSFPFQIVYEVLGDTIIIYAVHHGNKHPDKRFKK